MKASAVRDIVFAHAIETTAPHEALPNAARRDAITQDALHAVGRQPGQGKAGQAAFAQFLQARAQRIVQASQLPADVRQLWQHAPGIARWVPAALLVLALAAGFASHRITDPHRVDLLSLSLIGIVVWNLLVYAWIVAHGLLRLFRLARPAPPVPAPLQPTDAASRGEQAAPVDGHAAKGWLQRLQARTRHAARGSGLRKTALTFERNWWQISQAPRHAQWLLWLHLGAALMAAGALASLWITGLTREYQVGWESTFLSPTHVQQCLNTLFAPVQWLWSTQPWSLAEIQSLQGWAPGTQHPAGTGEPVGQGQRWVIAYTALLAVVVIVPRLLLALWQGLRWWWLQSHMQLPLNQPYFAQLQRDFGGLATQLQIVPYSFDITAERRAAIEQYAAQHYGAGVQLQWLPTVPYGAEWPAETDTRSGQTVALISLAATPEAEIHGTLLNALHARAASQASVWLWTSDFVQRNAGAPRRVQERVQLWQDFARNAGLAAQLVGDSSPPSSTTAP